MRFRQQQLDNSLFGGTAFLHYEPVLGVLAQCRPGARRRAHARQVGVGFD